MPAHRGGADIERLRDAVAIRVEATSLRQVAREVGVSPSGLQKFLGGADPYSATRRKLERWLVKETASYGGTLSAGSAWAALQVLAQDLAPSRRGVALHRLVGALEAAYGEVVPHPDWLSGVRALLEESYGRPAAEGTGRRGEA